MHELVIYIYIRISLKLCFKECPFGFGIRHDRKIIPGERAQEWIKRDIQKENE